MPKPSQRSQALQASEFSYYLNKPGLLWCYQEINKAGSFESEVDVFYLNFLTQIFKLDDGFVLDQESRTPSDVGVAQRVDFTIRSLRNGGNRRVILCENKKREAEFQSGVWAEALGQVVRYATLIRGEAGHNPNEPLYLTVNIGSYLRFYELPARSTKVEDWAPAGGQLLELANDEEQVWQLWHKLRDLVMRR